MTQANIIYSVKSWEQKPWHDDSVETTGAKVFRVERTHRYEGDIEADATAQYLISHNADGTGKFVALEKVTGHIGHKTGTFVFQRMGTFGQGKITETLAVIPETATGDLNGLRGQATAAHDAKQERFSILFDYEFR